MGNRRNKSRRDDMIIGKNLWTQSRTMEMFKEWFEYSLFTMILDTQDSGIEKT